MRDWFGLEFHNEIPKQVEDLVLEFEKVFQEPRGLPPSRSHNHSIVLKEGTSPISIQLYRYLYYQKAKIEKFVKEKLAIGIVRPNQSPFLSPVLLVRKRVAPEECV